MIGRRRLSLHVAPGRVRAEFARGRRTVWTGEAEYADPADLAEAIAQLAGEPALRRAGPVEVSVEPPLAQLRRLGDLPPVSGRALAGLVAHQQRRFFRRNGAPLLTGAVWERPRRVWQRPQLAHAAAVDEGLAEAIARGLGAAGLRLRAVRPAGATPRLRLVPQGEALARRHRLLRSLRRWSAAAALVWTAAGAGYLYRVRAADERLAAAIEELAPAAEAVRRARIPYEDGRAVLAQIAHDEAASMQLAARLAAMATALPDSAVITTIELDSAGRGTVSGLAWSAQQVVAALERSGAVMAPRLDGVVAREAFGGREWDRFTIAFGREAE